jgi:hypothetical protein
MAGVVGWLARLDACSQNGPHPSRSPTSSPVPASTCTSLFQPGRRTRETRHFLHPRTIGDAMSCFVQDVMPALSD